MCTATTKPKAVEPLIDGFVATGSWGDVETMAMYGVDAGMAIAAVDALIDAKKIIELNSVFKVRLDSSMSKSITADDSATVMQHILLRSVERKNEITIMRENMVWLKSSPLLYKHLTGLFRDNKG